MWLLAELWSRKPGGHTGAAAQLRDHSLHPGKNFRYWIAGRDEEGLGKWDLNEFFKGEFAIHILVHLPEDLVRPLLWRRLVFWHLHHRPHLMRGRVTKICKFHISRFGPEKNEKGGGKSVSFSYKNTAPPSWADHKLQIVSHTKHTDIFTEIFTRS